MTTGLTNFSADDDPAMPSLLPPGDEAEPGMSDTAEDVSALGADASDGSNAESWRSEVAARLQRYRTRRKPSSPRYPSLLLPFDPPQYRYHSSAPAAASESTREFGTTTESNADLTAPCNESSHAPASPGQEPRQQLAQYLDPFLETSAKIIEFPRYAAIPVSHASDLADPVIDRPRIVEAPEVLPPPPALGGMLMEPVRNRASERSDEFGSAVSPASIVRRGMAFLLDGVILGSALAVFAAIFLRLDLGLDLKFSHERGSLVVFIEAFASITVVVWMIYAFLFVVYTGSTPGLRVARLQLVRFDGTPIDRHLRRWRVVASFLSAFSAGLGYAWCLLDEKGLCWHDRITRTYVQVARK
jgi:uncharacterized RDD family membrane protein YckC